MSRQKLNLFQKPQITYEKQYWLMFDTSNRTMYVNPDLFPLKFMESLEDLDLDYDGKDLDKVFNTVKDYLDAGSELYCVRMEYGYGCRTSAPGYLDCTDWSVFDTKNECYEHLADLLDISISSVKKYIMEV